MTESRGFVAVQDLELGERVIGIQRDGSIQVNEIEDIEIVYYEEPQRVYNFEVAEWHTYLIEEQGFFVHNGRKCVGKRPARITKKPSANVPKRLCITGNKDRYVIKRGKGKRGRKKLTTKSERIVTVGGKAPKAVKITKKYVPKKSKKLQTNKRKVLTDNTKKSSKGGSKTNTLTNAQKSRLNSLENTINDHLTEGDFSGTLRDLQGNPVPNGNGGYFDHLGEMKDSYAALNKIKRGLEGSLRNPNLSDVDRSILEEGLNNANSYISRIQEMFKPYGGID